MARKYAVQTPTMPPPTTTMLPGLRGLMSLPISDDRKVLSNLATEYPFETSSVNSGRANEESRGCYCRGSLECMVEGGGGGGVKVAFW